MALLAAVGLLVTGAIAPPAAAAETSTVLYTVAVGTGPRAVAITSDGATAVVANHSSGSVSIVDTATGTVSYTVNVGNQPSDVAISADNASAYVTVFGTFGDPTSSKFMVINLVSGAITKTLTDTDGLYPYPTNILLGPDPGLVYLYTTNPAQWVQKLTLATDTFAGWNFGGSTIRSAALSPDGAQLIIVPSLASGNVETVATATMSLESRVALGKACSGVAYSADGTTAYISHNLLDEVSVVSTANLTGTSRSSGGDGPYYVAVSTAGVAYVTNQDGALGVLAPTTTTSLAVGSDPTSLVLTADEERVLMTNYTLGTLTATRTSDLTTETIVVRVGPFQVATAAGIAVVSNEGTDDVSIIRLADLPASGDQVPSAPIQQYARLEGEVCGVIVPDSVLFPGVGEDQRYLSWGPSWAWWPNAATGGFVCTRQPYYTATGTWSVR